VKRKCHEYSYQYHKADTTKLFVIYLTLDTRITLHTSSVVGAMHQAKMMDWVCRNNRNAHRETINGLKNKKVY
jgi:hypothetical protein